MSRSTRTLHYFRLIFLFLFQDSQYVWETQASASSKIALGGLFPLHASSRESKSECDPQIRPWGFQAAHAMIYAIDKINKDNTILANITLDGKIFDTCANTVITTSHTRQLVQMKILKDFGMPLAGVIGAAGSDISAKVANILQVFEIPQISYASTSVLLSDKHHYSYFLRTVASDSFQVQAMVDVCLTFNWRYVMTVSSTGIYGTSGMEGFTELAEHSGLCTDHIITLKHLPHQNIYHETIRRIVKRRKDTMISAVVIFCTTPDAIGIIRAAQQNKDTKGLVWIVSDSWHSTVIDLTGINILAIEILEPDSIPKDYVNYFKSLNPNDPRWKNDIYLREFWQHVFQCSLTNDSALPKCTGNESLYDTSYPVVSPHSVINAVNAFAYALDFHQRELCPNYTGFCEAMTFYEGHHLLEHLLEVSFKDYKNSPLQFNKDGEVEAKYAIMNFRETKKEYARVGTWLSGRKKEGLENLELDEDLIQWHSVDTSPPKSHCSDVCPFGSISRPRPGYNHSCCWVCHACNKLQIIVNNTCLYGPIGYVPAANRTMWVKREVVYLKWNEHTPTLFITISLLSIILTLLTLLVFTLFSNHRTVKATGREMNYIILSGILLCFLVPFLHIGKPNDAICYARKSSVGLALAIIYAALFMKLNRIYRIFQSAKNSARRPAFVRPKPHILVTFGLISIHLLFVSMWFLIEPLRAIETYDPYKEELLLQCNTHPLHFLGSLSYVIILMVLCTVYAFKTRKFPKNYNESKYIAVTLYTTCVVSTLFVAFFLNTDDRLTADLLISGASIAWGLITLLGLYAQRIYLVLFASDAGIEHRVKLTGSQSITQHIGRELNLKRTAKVSDSSHVIITKGYKKRSVSF